MDKINYLQSEWNALQLSANKTSQLVLDNLIQQYSSPHRFYHNCDHLVHVLELLHQSSMDEPAAYWATFYHDYIYVAGDRNNEPESGKIAAIQMAALGIESSVIEKTVYLIEATAQHKTKSAEWMNVFLDADMAILGVVHERYNSYRENVRREFAAIPEFLYKQGRKKFLQKCLEENRLFKTEWFFNRFEDQARKNIQWELTVL